MPRPDGRIEPGQPLRGAISARAWNRAQDAADVVLGAYAGTEGVQGSPVLKPYTWCYCQASVTVPQWGILAITGVATTSYQEMPVLTGGTPTDTTTAWCVAVEPIAGGKIGRVAVGGAVVCKIEVSSAGDKFAACKASSAELKSGSKGEGLILWNESGTGSGKWAIVRLASSSAESGGGAVLRGTFTGALPKGSSAVVTNVTGLQPSTPITAMNYFADITGTGTKNCAITMVGEEYILIAVEC